MTFSPSTSGCDAAFGAVGADEDEPAVDGVGRRRDEPRPCIAADASRPAAADDDGP